MASIPKQSNELSVLDSGDESVAIPSFSLPYFEGLTVQLEYFDLLVLG